MERWLDISEKYIAGLNQESIKPSDENSKTDGQPIENIVPVENCNSEQVDSGNASSNPDSSSKPTDRNIHWEKSIINLESTADQPEFPLLPASRGFCLTLRKTLAAFRNILETHNS